MMRKEGRSEVDEISEVFLNLLICIFNITNTFTILHAFVNFDVFVLRTNHLRDQRCYVVKSMFQHMQNFIMTLVIVKELIFVTC